jgi:hypothetical protein
VSWLNEPSRRSPWHRIASKPTARGWRSPSGRSSSAEVDRLVRAGRLDPIPYFRRHTRGDWGDVNVQQWQANSTALQSGASLESHYVIHPGLAIRIVTDAQRSATVIVLPSED